MWLSHMVYTTYLPAPAPPPVVSPPDVCDKLLKVKPCKAHGPDEIPNRILRDFAFELAGPICTIFNKSLSSGVFPSIWKAAYLSPVPRVNPPQSLDDFRPIALTSTLSKILEDFVVTWMIHDAQDNIDPKQFGSLKGSSTCYCLIYMVNNWLQAFWINPQPICKSVLSISARLSIVLTTIFWYRSLLTLA